MKTAVNTLGEQRRKTVVGLWVTVFVLCAHSSAFAVKTATQSGYWTNSLTWQGGSMPVNGDDVVINNGVTVTADVSTVNMNSLTNNGILTFAGWNTVVTATTVQVNGTITHTPNSDTNGADGWTRESRVYIVCTDLTVAAGGKIDADAQGFRGNWIGNGKGYGPGGGFLAFPSFCGGGYGGRGGGIFPSMSLTNGMPYGSTDDPVDPGSGGAGIWDNAAGHGGGAIRIEAANNVTVDGTITANGGSNGGALKYAAGGSGGSIYIICNTFQGTDGTITANGGSGRPATYGGGGGAGGGGRIAVKYNPGAQSGVPIPSVQISAMGGASFAEADLGTLYFPDTRLMTETITFNGRLMVPGLANWSPNSLVVSNAWVRFPQDGLVLTVTNDMTLVGSATRMELGGSEAMSYMRESYAYQAIVHFSETSGPTLNIGGSLTLSDSASLCVYSGPTNGLLTNGAAVSVAGDVTVNSNCWIFPHSHPTNGGSVLFTMQDLMIETNAGFNADGTGYKGANTEDPDIGIGPGRGVRGTTPYLYNAGGGGYGGRGGYGPETGGGSTYGSSNAPVEPGSGGGDLSSVGKGNAGFGGGLIRIEARGTATLQGTLSADGDSVYYINGYGGGGGSGGGIYLTCHTFAGQGGLITADGGMGDNLYYESGGGGGGRIALWRVKNKYVGLCTTSVTGGVGGDGFDGETGTVVWGWILVPGGTVITIR